MAPVTRVQLFVTCLVDTFTPGTGLAVVELLERLGVAVECPGGLTCCGQPGFNAGFEDEARRLARHTVDTLSRSDAPVVVPSGSCAEMIVHHYPRLLAGEPSYETRAGTLAARTYELSQFLVDVLGVRDVGARFPGRLAYHASCHGLRGLGVRRQPEALLDRVRDATRGELPEADVCCGFGGAFSVVCPDLSAAMLARKLDGVERSGADAIVVTDAGCQLHMAGALRRRGGRVRVLHLAQVLAERGR